MKLAEALIQRADGLKRIRELKSRLATSVKVQEGDQPFEDPYTLIAELEELMTRFQELVKRINRTNVQVEFETGKTLADALAERDVLQMRSRIYTDLQETSSNSPFGLRLSRSPPLPVGEGPDQVVEGVPYFGNHGLVPSLVGRNGGLWAT